MNFEKFIITCKTIDELKHHILYLDKYNEPNTINIYHITIGSKTYIYTNADTTTEHDHHNHEHHNHEFSSFIKKIMHNPLQQFSPSMIANLHQYSETHIQIRNIVILIDPAYLISPVLEGFKGLSDYFTGNLSNETIVQHCNDTYTLIKTNIEIIKVPIDITEEQVINIVEILNNIGNLYSVLINIMDCTSCTLTEYYARCTLGTTVSKCKSNSQIYITRPCCMLKDNNVQYNPVITLDDDNIGSSKKIDRIHRTTHTHTHIPVRWVNCITDAHLIAELEQVLDICQASQITHSFLIESYKYNIGLELLISIVKIWSRLSYTNIQEISLYPDSYEGKTELSINFSKLSFGDFIKYWKSFVLFRDYIINSIDNYYKHNVKYFIDEFICKYEKQSSCFSISFSIIEALQIEALDIFKKLFNYCKNDAKYIIENITCFENHSLLERKNILNYLISNNVSL